MDKIQVDSKSPVDESVGSNSHDTDTTQILSLTQLQELFDDSRAAGFWPPKHLTFRNHFDENNPNDDDPNLQTPPHRYICFLYPVYVSGIVTNSEFVATQFTTNLQCYIECCDGGQFFNDFLDSLTDDYSGLNAKEKYIIACIALKRLNPLSIKSSDQVLIEEITSKLTTLSLYMNSKIDTVSPFMQSTSIQLHRQNFTLNIPLYYYDGTHDTPERYLDFKPKLLKLLQHITFASFTHFPEIFDLNTETVKRIKESEDKKHLLDIGYLLDFKVLCQNFYSDNTTSFLVDKHKQHAIVRGISTTVFILWQGSKPEAFKQAKKELSLLGFQRSSFMITEVIQQDTTIRTWLATEMNMKIKSSIEGRLMQYIFKHYSCDRGKISKITCSLIENPEFIALVLDNDATVTMDNIVKEFYEIMADICREYQVANDTVPPVHCIIFNYQNNLHIVPSYYFNKENYNIIGVNRMLELFAFSKQLEVEQVHERNVKYYKDHPDLQPPALYRNQIGLSVPQSSQESLALGQSLAESDDIGQANRNPVRSDRPQQHSPIVHDVAVNKASVMSMEQPRTSRLEQQHIQEERKQPLVSQSPLLGKRQHSQEETKQTPVSQSPLQGKRQQRCTDEDNSQSKELNKSKPREKKGQKAQPTLQQPDPVVIDPQYLRDRSKLEEIKSLFYTDEERALSKGKTASKRNLHLMIRNHLMAFSMKRMFDPSR